MFIAFRWPKKLDGESIDRNRLTMANVTCTRNITTIMTLYNNSFQLIDDDLTIYEAAIKYMTPIWILVGIPGAVLSIAVWSHRRMRNSSSMYLIALSVVDVTFFVVRIFLYLYNSWHIGVLNVDVFCQLFPIVNNWTMYLSPLLTFGFTVERYISICHPFQREQYCTVRRALLVIGCLVVWTCAVASVQGYFYEFRGGVCTENAALFDPNSLAYRFWQGWAWLTEMLHFGLVPLANFVCNLLVIIETKRIMRRSVGAVSKSRNSVTTVMLLTVSFYQILATLPATVCYVAFFFMQPHDTCLTVQEALQDKYWKRYFTFMNVRAFVEVFSFSHYAIKLYIYILTGAAFRKQFLIMFCGCLPKSRRGQQDLTYEKLYPTVSRSERLRRANAMDGGVGECSTTPNTKSNGYNQQHSDSPDVEMHALMLRGRP